MPPWNRWTTSGKKLKTIRFKVLLPKKRKTSVARKAFGLAWKCLFFLWMITLLQVFLLRFVNPPFTAVMIWEWTQGKGTSGDFQLRNSWRPLNEISPHLRRAVLAGEDQRFLSHHGFDLVELKQAIKDMSRKNKSRGASTITMQTARTVFLWPQRTWLRKALEAYYTLLMELFWKKRRILEVYLNTVDWGRGIRGAEAASRRYFNIPSSRISRPQAAMLTAVLPSPYRWSPTRPSAYVIERQKRILRDMEKMPLLSRVAFSEPCG